MNTLKIPHRMVRHFFVRTVFTSKLFYAKSSARQVCFLKKHLPCRDCRLLRCFHFSELRAGERNREKEGQYIGDRLRDLDAGEAEEARKNQDERDEEDSVSRRGGNGCLQPLADRLQHHV